jgi:hypothetical protein
MSGPGGTSEISPLVEFMLLNAGLADTPITEHVDDGRGYCRACSLGAQRGWQKFPCDIRCNAARAREIERARR